jgi:hypothetical protein
MESVKRYSRRSALKLGVGLLGLGGLAACAPATEPQVQVVKETVEVPASTGPVEIR